MATVLLSILKITGIVLLCLIGLILLVAAIILFVPIRYRIRADKPLDDGFTADAGASFLLHILSLKFLFNGEFDYYVKLFGIRIYPKKNKGEDKEETVPDESKPEDIPDTSQALETEGSMNDELPGEEDYTIDWNDFAEDEQETSQYSDVEDEDDERLVKKLEEIIEKLSLKYERIAQKYDSIRYKIRFFDKMRNDCRNREAFEYIKVKAIKLLKKIAPRSVKGFVHFGFEDPATTGKILMYLALIYPILPRKLTIDPGFEDTDIYGNVKIKGHISLITPAMCFLGVYFNRNCRRMWRLYKKYKDKVS